MNTLFLRLEGPLQSWGIRARWGERDTTDAPTKSGVIGLIGCALGLHRDNDNLRVLSEMFRFGVRIDRPGQLLRDYHTTGGGTYGKTRHDGSRKRYADQAYAGGVPSAAVEKGRILVKINQTAKEPETDTSNRFYLMDASFLAAMQGGTASEVQELADALQNPVWPYFLGRKACVPAKPVYAEVGDFADLMTALTTLDGQWEVAARAQWPLRILLEVPPGQGNRQNDNILGPGRRLFTVRYVDEEPFYRPFEPEEATDINTLEG